MEEVSLNEISYIFGIIIIIMKTMENLSKVNTVNNLMKG